MLNINTRGKKDSDMLKSCYRYPHCLVGGLQMVPEIKTIFFLFQLLIWVKKMKSVLSPNLIQQA